MRIRKPLVAFAVALALLALDSDETSGQPRPPGPPPMAPRPPGPVMGPVGGPRPPVGIGGPGGIGGPPRPPGGTGGMPVRPGGYGPVGPGVPGGMAGPGHPGSIGPGGMGGMPVRPGGYGPVGPVGPGGMAGPGRPGIGPVGPGSYGGTGGPAYSPGLGGLGSLAKSGAFARHSPTVAVNGQSLANQGNQVRNSFNNYDRFHGKWWDRYPGAWRAAQWGTAAAVYRSATWAACASYCGYADEPVYYDYGSNVVYSSDNAYAGDVVYVNGETVASQEQYAQQAMTIAGTGRQARATEDDEWLPLGVFAMTQGEQVNANDLFQLAVNKSGVIRGNYYNALSDTTLPAYGSVDKKTQRAAWTVGDRKEPIFEAGIANLTKSETTMLVHLGKGRTQQWTLVRIDQSAESK